MQQLAQQLKDKGTDLAIKDYDAETSRLKALGAVDPMLVQMIARQLWENMQQTDIIPHIQNHAALEQSLQPPPAPTNGATPPASAPAAPAMA